MWDTEAITIHVASDVAQSFRETPTAQQRKMEALLSLRLRELTQQTPSLQETMQEISRNAQERGLTPELLDSLLHEE